MYSRAGTISWPEMAPIHEGPYKPDVSIVSIQDNLFRLFRLKTICFDSNKAFCELFVTALCF